MAGPAAVRTLPGGSGGCDAQAAVSGREGCTENLPAHAATGRWILRVKRAGEASRRFWSKGAGIRQPLHPGEPDCRAGRAEAANARTLPVAGQTVWDPDSKDGF